MWGARSECALSLELAEIISSGNCVPLLENQFPWDIKVIPMVWSCIQVFPNRMKWMAENVYCCALCWMRAFSCNAAETLCILFNALWHIMKICHSLDVWTMDGYFHWWLIMLWIEESFPTCKLIRFNGNWVVKLQQLLSQTSTVPPSALNLTEAQNR